MERKSQKFSTDPEDLTSGLTRSVAIHLNVQHPFPQPLRNISSLTLLPNPTTLTRKILPV
jgi:hypothetical protein